ncbi:MAG: ATP-binding cassette domain-containing protein [Anaeroplasmataceae bacterium]|nr:ATP-binding cassette domain-containing protein [Anaeroplasmataceae bacterium]
MIEVKNAKKVYKNKSEVKCAFEEINLEFNSAGLVVILGSSGSGKTSFLNCLSGLDELTEGSITGIGKNDASFVFQDYQLIEDLSVLDNLSLAVAVDEKKIQDILDELNLIDVPLSKKVYNLSGGQKQRVAIARALLLDKKVLFADEPTGNLDEENSVLVAQLLKKISQRKLVIVVSHEKQLFENIADQVIYLNHGRIEESKGTTFQGEESENTTLKPHLSFKTALYISLKRIKKSFGRFTLNTILLFVIFLTFLLCLAFISNDSYQSYAKGFEEAGLDNIDFFPTEDSFMQRKSISLIEEETNFIKDKTLVVRKPYMISKDTIFSEQLNGIYVTDYFSSDQRGNSNSIYISSYLAEKIIFKRDISLEQFVGMDVEINDAPCHIVDIVKSPVVYREDQLDFDEIYSRIYCNTETFNHIKRYESLKKQKINIDCRFNTSTGYTISTLQIHLEENLKQLSKNEILINQSFLENHFKEDFSNSIGKTIQVLFQEKKEEREFIIRGIITDPEIDFIVSLEQFEDIIELNFNPQYGISLTHPNASLIKTLEQLNYFHFMTISSELYSMTAMMTLFIGIFVIIFISVFIILILFDFSLITNSILIKRREIGILKAMGLNSRSISKLFIGDNMLSILIAFVLSLVGLSLSLLYINHAFIERKMCSTAYLYFNYAYALFILLLLGILFGTYLGLSQYKLSKKSDIELVYEK